MGVAAAIGRFRRRQESLFTSTVRVERVTGQGAFDPNTGQHAADPESTIYEGAALVRPLSEMATRGQDVVAGEGEVRLRYARLKVPAGTAIEKDDTVTVTASTFDVGLVGRVYRVTDVLHDEWQIVRVAILEEVTGGP